ncbi:putative serine/threonine-protein kinase PBL22 [Bidens hawaiensis]|uniref:putative serine/threonine-protein kinase PBL22 n=1 Tax=Bidens hawaiensis TaxID=980011 RepID=UPI00404B5B5D
MKQFEHLKIQLDVIKEATKDFADESCIGRGGFGSVYKGMIPGHTMVALKRLNPIYGQGDTEFWKEVMMLSQYKHENIVSLIGFCDDSCEKILVYPYVPNKSLDCHLNNDNLGWVKRLKICIGAAQGLKYLHNPNGTQQRVLHRDIKSSNILLDEDWNAKISDFGLSKLGPANQEHTFLISKAVGTHGYVDPVYAKTGFLTKESDVYSFGVVLFEVLCGRLCVDNKNDAHPYLIDWAQKSYKQDTIKEIICAHIKDEINSDSLQVFAAIAYKCLHKDHEKRPLMSDILGALEHALHYQEARNDLVASSYFSSDDPAKIITKIDKDDDSYMNPHLKKLFKDFKINSDKEKIMEDIMKKYDKDGDGHISFNELTEFLQDISFTWNKKKTLMEEDIMKGFDKDGDTELKENERRQDVKFRQLKTVEERMKEFDKDGDGKVTMDEVVERFTKWFDETKNNAVDKLFVIRNTLENHKQRLC